MKTKFYFLFITLILLCTNSYAAELTAQVDRQAINMNESLRLVVATDEVANGNIDFSQLENQFDIINQQRSQRQQTINGRTLALTQWILILAPKETGNLLIPSFRYQNTFSEAIEITVAEAPTNEDTQTKDIFLELTADKTSAYVQEQILLKTRLYYKVSLSSYEAPEFKLKDTNVELVSETTYKTSLNNERYQVLELIHALYPQASGTLTVPTLRWRLEKPSRGFFDRSGNPYLFVQSNSLTIDIKPIPANSTAKHWLPSTAITLTPEWQQSPLEAKVGEPLNLSLRLTANGLSAAQLPEIPLTALYGLEIFTDQSITNDIKSGNGTIGSRTSRFALIPQSTGELILPAINLLWWNVNSDSEVQVSLPELRIIVAQSNLRQEKLPTLAEIDEGNSLDNTAQTHSSFWQAVILLLAIISICGLYLLFRFKKSSTNMMQAHTDMPVVESTSLSEKQLIRSIQQCINQNKLNALPALLIQWGQVFFNDSQITTTVALGEKIPELKKELIQLNQHLYQKSTNSQWQADNLLSIIKQQKKEKFQSSNNEILKPLYR